MTTDPHMILRRIADQFPELEPDVFGSVLHALLDEEGPEALIQAILDAAQDTP